MPVESSNRLKKASASDRWASLGAILVALAMTTMAAVAFVPAGAASHGEGNPECPTDLRLTQLRITPSPVLVNWTHAEGSDATNVYRSIGDEPMEHIATVSSDEMDFYADEETEGGEEHTYEVRAVYGEHESEDCPQESTFVREFSGAPTRVCPDEIDLVATPNRDGSVTLEAEDLDREADLERRLAGESEWTFITTMDWDDNTHRDHTTEAHNTYEYRLVIQGENIEDDECDRAEVTAIPFFGGSAALAALSAVGIVGAYLVARRND